MHVCLSDPIYDGSLLFSSQTLPARSQSASRVAETIQRLLRERCICKKARIKLWPSRYPEVIRLPPVPVCVTRRVVGYRPLTIANWTVWQATTCTDPFAPDINFRCRYTVEFTEKHRFSSSGTRRSFEISTKVRRQSIKSTRRDPQPARPAAG